MPQMSPLYWLFLYFYFILLFLLMNILIYFLVINFEKKIKMLNKIKIFKFKWLW